VRKNGETGPKDEEVQPLSEGDPSKQQKGEESGRRASRFPSLEIHITSGHEGNQVGQQKAKMRGRNGKKTGGPEKAKCPDQTLSLNTY